MTPHIHGVNEDEAYDEVKVGGGIWRSWWWCEGSACPGVGKGTDEIEDDHHKPEDLVGRPPRPMDRQVVETS